MAEQSMSDGDGFDLNKSIHFYSEDDLENLPLENLRKIRRPVRNNTSETDNNSTDNISDDLVDLSSFVMDENELLQMDDDDLQRNEKRISRPRKTSVDDFVKNESVKNKDFQKNIAGVKNVSGAGQKSTFGVVVPEVEEDDDTVEFDEKSANRKRHSGQAGSAENDDKRNKIIAAIVALVLLFGGAVLVMEHPWSSGGNAQQSVALNDTGFWYDSSKTYPVALDDWQKNNYQLADLDALKNQFVHRYDGTEFGNAASVLPRESDGFTSDTSKAMLANGSPNPKYSYWTYETFVSQTSTILERILNPTFGGWGSYQYAHNHPDTTFNQKSVADMYTQKALMGTSTKKNQNWVPMYVDWDENDYGLSGQLLDVGPRWYGKVVSTKTQFSYDEEQKMYVVDLGVNVQFTAWRKDQSKVQRNGVLHLELVPNKGDYANSSSNKVLVNSSSLNVDISSQQVIH